MCVCAHRAQGKSLLWRPSSAGGRTAKGKLHGPEPSAGDDGGGDHWSAERPSPEKSGGPASVDVGQVPLNEAFRVEVKNGREWEKGRGET